MSGFQKGPEDWICSDVDCSNVNYARRTHCHRCKLERKDARKASAWDKKKLGTEIGKTAADKSRGLFSAEDWQCSQCANVNWSRRQTCNMCNAPKFNKEAEERTGIGGGYNERGNVEYKRKSRSSDDEYDEFGRRKKKDTRPKDSPRGERKDQRREEEEDDDDEEEDDEEGDLSKYNLWDSDNEEKTEKKEEKREENPSTSKRKERSKSTSSSSRSRSRSSSSSRSARGTSSKSRKRRYSRSSSSSSSSSSGSSHSRPRKRR